MTARDVYKYFISKLPPRYYGIDHKTGGIYLGGLLSLCNVN